MQFRVFTVPVHDDGSAQDELNRFLRAHRVLAARQEFVADGANSLWCFCVEYVAGDSRSPGRSTKTRIDYKQVLEEAQFKVFARLRACRKQIANEEGVPAFAVFTDAQLADMAQLAEVTLDSLKSISGVGQGKVDRYGERFVNALTEPETDETSGQSVQPDC